MRGKTGRRPVAEGADRAKEGGSRGDLQGGPGLEKFARLVFLVYKMFIIRAYIRAEEPRTREMFEGTLDLFTRGLFLP